MDIKSFLDKRVEQAGKMYLQDLEAMSEEQLRSAPGDARSPYDFTYECVFINDRVATRLRGEDPGPWPERNGFLKAPEEFCRKDHAVSEFRRSLDGILAGWRALPEDRLDEKIATPGGETSALDMLGMISVHLPYHDGQLNYHQAIGGDAEIHWKFDE